jgi:tricorn protease
VNKARDAYPRFSPDGKWIAFSSDRNGNLDVFLMPAGGGTAKQLTSHSADDTVWAGRRTAKASSSAASAGKTSWVCFTW